MGSFRAALAVSYVLCSALSALLGCAARATPRGAPQPATVQIASCSAPAALPLGRPLTASTARAESRREGSCVRAEAPECLYQLEVTERSDLRASLLSADFDGALSLLAGADGAGGELACVDDAPLGDTHHTRLDLTLDPGKYLLVVDGASGEAGRFELFAELEPLPAPSQLCGAAPLLEEGVYVRGSTRGGANLFAASCGARGPGPDDVYGFSLERPARVRIRAQSDFEAVLSLRARCTDADSELVCGDDGVGGQMLLSAELAAGRYYVLVDGYARGEGGDYVLAIERAERKPPVDPAAACAAARTIAADGKRHELDTLYQGSALSGSCGGRGAPEALFRFSLARRSAVSVELSELELNAVVFVRRACEDEHTELACALIPRSEREFAPLPAPKKALTLELEPGEYVLGVDGQQPSDMGAATLTLSAAPAGP